MPIKVREAVQKASEYFSEAMDGKASGFMLEEVDTSNNRDWLVTLSAWIPETKPPATTPTAAVMAELFRPDHVRIFRMFDVDAETGDVKSMKIRKVE